MMKFDLDAGNLHVHVGHALIGTICACLTALTFCFCSLMIVVRDTVAILPAQIQSTRDVLVRSLEDEMLKVQTQMDDREHRMDSAAQILREERHELLLRK
jgi:hypothetical protein